MTASRPVFAAAAEEPRTGTKPTAVLAQPASSEGDEPTEDMQAAPAAAKPANAAATPAAPAATVAAKPAEPAKKNATAEKFAGSYFLLRNMTSATSFSKSAYTTYNPENSMALLWRPRFAITDRVFVSGWQYTNLELTNSDSTSKKNEVVFSDTIVSLGYTPLKNKEMGLTASTDFHVILPTSKAAQMKTMMFGAGVGGHFDGVEGGGAEHIQPTRMTAPRGARLCSKKYVIFFQKWSN